jgi:AdoMet-dependent rRNA methyltransferase SPB1
MPANALIVGVDLSPIKPIPRTITFQSDITTDKCRATIRSHLKTWKADTVLHDGAPNVGTAWVQDAFSQAELVLQAMKLATEFLVEGGTFVTKVFRSKDYNALLWVFNQLFAKVEATKPPSSRNVSAEIFVVCRGFKAPKRIDPKFLDPRSVFAELSDPTPNNEAKVFNPEKKKRKRDGYVEGEYIQFKEVPASEFIQTTDPIAMLGSLNKLSFDHEPNGDIALAALDRLPETTPEIKHCCQDLKVLGRKEFRMLLRWRLKVREIFGFSSKKKTEAEAEAEEVAVVTPMDEELRIQEELQELNDRESSRKKKDKRRENERKQREIVRMQMHMMPPTEIGLEQAGPNGEDSMFRLSAVERAGAIDRIARGKMAVNAPPSDTKEDELAESSDELSDDEEDQLDRELETLYERYQDRKSEADAKFRAKKARKEHDDGEWSGLSGDEQNQSDSDELREEEDSEQSSSEDEAMPKSAPRGQTADGSKIEGRLTKRASLFFDQDIFAGIGDLDAESDNDSAIDMKVDNEEADQMEGVVPAATQPRGSRKRVSFASEAQPTLVHAQVPDNICMVGSDEQEESGFEIVKGETDEWEKQAETRPDGRLGEC